MKRFPITWILALTCLAPRMLAAEAPVSFSREILPILSEYCFACHGPDEGSRKAGLRLDTSLGALASGKSGELAIVPKHSTQSEVIRRLTSTDPDEVMPPAKSNRRLSTTQVELIRRWIDEGATWGKHWAFEPPIHPIAPKTRQPRHHPIDAFVQARLEKEGLSASPEAPRTTLLRRVSLDLTGLPPTSEETSRFLTDSSPVAYESVVDRLLASPRYGERMAWEWLEAARYADSNGYQGDNERTMWPWRDWVVDAFNRNLPFDQFTIWQLAGDRLPSSTDEQKLATGFLRNHMINGEGGRIPEENRIEYLFDQAETVATVWLGATFNCTRCHDHKYDPYTQRDYFGLIAFFNQTMIDGSGGNPQSPPNLARPTAEETTALSNLEIRLSAISYSLDDFESRKFPRDNQQPITASVATTELPKEVLETLKIPPRDRDPGRLEPLIKHWRDSDPSYAQLLDEYRTTRQQRDATSRSIPRVMIMEDLPTTRSTYILNRGSYLAQGSEVGMSLPVTLSSKSLLSESNRLGLARWLVSPENPLTARVIVNRIWQSLFGIGLVKTSEDFGVQGEKPSHPELLDWLACEFVDSGWDVKHLIRRIVASDTYRQSTVATTSLIERDPENRLLARGPRFRMPSWMIRDTALAHSQLLVNQLGGSSVKPYQPSGVWEEATFGNKKYEQDHGEALYRRSLYVFWRRIIGPTMFFDVASRQTCTVKTPRTNVPLHALLTLNDVGYLETARTMAQQVLQRFPTDSRDGMSFSYQQILRRNPTQEEQSILIQGLERHRRHFSSHPEAASQLLSVGEIPRDTRLNPIDHAAWTVICSTLFNLDESLTKE